MPGNHDEFLRDYYRHAFRRHRGGARRAIHEAADGQRYLVIHGDHVRLGGDARRAGSRILGDKAYDFALTVNSLFNGVRRRLGLPYWSLSPGPS